MVWVRVAFHENDGNHENDENDEDNSDSYKQGVECWIRGNHGNHENDENHENPGFKPRVPQTTGLEILENLILKKKPFNNVQTRCIVKGRGSGKVHFSGDFLGVFDFLRIACSLGIPQENL